MERERGLIYKVSAVIVRALFKDIKKTRYIIYIISTS